MDVVYDLALVRQFVVQVRRAGLGLLELIAEIGVVFLEALAMTGQVTASFADEEAEGRR